MGIGSIIAIIFCIVCIGHIYYAVSFLFQIEKKFYDVFVKFNGPIREEIADLRKRVREIERNTRLREAERKISTPDVKHNPVPQIDPGFQFEPHHDEEKAILYHAFGKLKTTDKTLEEQRADAAKAYELTGSEKKEAEKAYAKIMGILADKNQKPNNNPPSQQTSTSP